jgi:Ca-activated chloride channel family protein
MNQPLPLLTDDQVQQSVPNDDEAGFGSLATQRGHLPLQAMDIQVRIDGLLGQVDLRQTFVNTLDEPLEATYIFPLPDRAAVTRFHMEVAGRVIDGVLQERAQARRDYEQAIQAGHRAAITEEERPNVFTLRVGNLMPGEKATVRLTLMGPLPVSDGEATFRFPLVVAPRYIPGNPLSGPSVGQGTVMDTDAVPDASRITPPVLLPGYPNPVQLSLAVEVRSGGLPLSDFRSSLHSVLTEEDGQVRRIRLHPGERLNRDFILRFRLGQGSIKTALVLTPDRDGEEGTFALTVLPPADKANAFRPRDVVFVLDRSGSMDGWKIVAARRALSRMVDTLNDRDRFSILAFNSTIETVPEWGGVGLVAATDRNRFRAVEFLAKMDARDGTEMAQPLDLAVRQLTSGSRDCECILVLVTDGQVGNEDQVLRSLASRVQNLRIFTLGIDRAVNEGFLRRLATLGGGMSEVVESEDRLDEVMDKIHRRIGTPVLTGLRLEPAGLRFEPETVAPARIPDLFAGVPLCILGRYRGRATGSLALQARDSAGNAWAETVGAQPVDNPAIASVWARGHIRELEDRFASGGGDRARLEKRIVDTSLGFSVLSRFTAFVAVDRSQIVNGGGQVHRITQPVESPAGWAMSGTEDQDLQRSSFGYGRAETAKVPRISKKLKTYELMAAPIPPTETYLSASLDGLSPCPEIDRGGEAFVGVNCGALSANLVESELFGHVRGAFTGSDRPRVGKFTAAGNGTLLLDEIDTMGLEQQAKLLRVIETGEFEPVGSNQTQHCTARIIVTCSSKLEEAVERGQFRADLYYRLKKISLPLLPLRERQQDIAPLVQGMTARSNAELHKNLVSIHPLAMAALEAFTWPNNIRELQNVVQRAVLISIGPELLLEFLPPAIHENLGGGRKSRKIKATEYRLDAVPQFADEISAKSPSRLRSGATANEPKASLQQVISQRLAWTPSLLPMMERIIQVASLDGPILLTGEGGAGKTYMARLIHECSLLKDQPPSPQQVDLRTYYPYAQEFLEQLLKQADKEVAARLGALRSFAVKLESLISDLKSAGAEVVQLHPLETLLQELKGLLSARRPKDSAIATAWSHAETVLGAFVGGSLKRQEAFWK